MALTAGTIFQVQASATTGNTGGSGFNTANANFPTDLATDANTANTASPIVSSATYNFRTGNAGTGDVGSYVYVKSGTHWQTGWYQIASVASNKATLTATIGSVVTAISATGIVTVNTTVGCTSDNTATLSSGTYGVDYSQNDTADSAPTNIAALTSSVTTTSASNPWSPVSVGNYLHVTAGGTKMTVGWYEIALYNSAGSVDLDRTANDGSGNGSGATAQTGGAGRLNGLELTYLNMLPATSLVWIKNGSYTISGATSSSNANSGNTTQSQLIGFNSIRGDTCNGANRPIIAAGANNLTFSNNTNIRNITFTSTAAAGIVIGNSAQAKNCKVTNSSTTAARVALTSSGTDDIAEDCETVSQNGTGISLAGAARSKITGCYIHDSVTGISGTATGQAIVGNIIEACSTDGINLSSTTGSYLIINNTIYGREAIMGNGINFSGASEPNNRVINNILYGLTVGITVSTGNQTSSSSSFNDFFNNTTDNTNWTKSSTDIALNPTFTGATQITGSTGSSSTTVLTDTNADFSTVTDNVDYVRLVTVPTTGAGCYLINSHTSTTLTVNNSIGTNAATITYFVTTGHNFAIGTNLKAGGFPTFSNMGIETTGYMDVGGVQRQEAGAAGMLYVPNLDGN